MLTTINSNASTNQPSKSPGLFSLHLTSNSTALNTTLSVPKQVMYLIGYRVEMTSVTTALAAKILYIDLPFLSENQLIDNNTDFSYLMLTLDSLDVTLQNSLDMPIFMSKDIPIRFNAYIKDSTSALASNVVSVTLQFRLDYGHIG
jgi:hypothetical protein